jgi:hypothetical protein
MSFEWVTRSALSLAPALFLLQFIGVTAISLTIGALGLGESGVVGSVAFLGVLCFLARLLGQRAALAEGGLVPRGRLWGAAALVGALFAVLVYFIYGAYEAEMYEAFEQMMASPDWQGGTPGDPYTLFQQMMEIAAVFFGLFVCALNGTFLALGARSIERHLPPGDRGPRGA